MMRAILCIALAGAITAAFAAEPEAVRAAHNPILADGTFYSADPAPIVIGDSLYILAGRDEAPPQTNDFVMNGWQLLASSEIGSWRHYPGFLRPEQLFAWAAPGRAYASQIVRGPDGKFYLYATVQRAACSDPDCMAIGVAVADSILGPWRDAHPAGAIVSQEVPEKNDMQNIDPTVFVDDDERVYLYWGTFGVLRAVELMGDMVTPKSKPITITELNGFFEAPWLFKRNGIYYLAFAANDTAPGAGCTPAIYHACIAYATATSPLGRWTRRGVILPPLSSTTSHPGIIAFKGRWYVAYHTADAKNGGHFRRSVAIDEMTWDDTVSPPAIRKVAVTPRPVRAIRRQRNVAVLARVSASNTPVPVRFWLKSLNDGIVPENPLPPDVWGTGRKAPVQSWIAYHWRRPLVLDGSRILFWRDRAGNDLIGAGAPRSWSLEYCQGRKWLPVEAVTDYPTDTDRFVAVRFKPVKTRCLRASFTSAAGNGVSVREWEALAAKPIQMVVEQH